MTGDQARRGYPGDTQCGSHNGHELNRRLCPELTVSRIAASKPRSAAGLALFSGITIPPECDGSPASGPHPIPSTPPVDSQLTM
jgi:hypothetical protein